VPEVEAIVAKNYKLKVGADKQKMRYWTKYAIFAHHL